MRSRPAKTNHLDTIQYEIDMLQFAFERVRQREWKDQRDSYAYLECFLLHYRNLIEFFGDVEDLKVSDWKVWSTRELSAAEQHSITDAGPCTRHRGPISQYLLHCTKGRVKDRGWDVEGMYGELAGVLTNFRRLFPVRPKQSSIAVLPKGASTVSSSTATITVSKFGFAEAGENRLPKKKT